MVIDHADALHEGIADRAANEAESSLLEILAHGV
jgi:hypothetical protein